MKIIQKDKENDFKNLVNGKIKIELTESEIKEVMRFYGFTDMKEGSSWCGVEIKII